MTAQPYKPHLPARALVMMVAVMMAYQQKTIVTKGCHCDDEDDDDGGDDDDHVGLAVHAGGVPAIKRVGAHCRDLQDRQLVNSVLLKYFCKYSSIQHYCFLYCSVAKCVPNVFLKHSNKKSSEHALCH